MQSLVIDLSKKYSKNKEKLLKIKKENKLKLENFKKLLNNNKKQNPLKASFQKSNKLGN